MLHTTIIYYVNKYSNEAGLASSLKTELYKFDRKTLRNWFQNIACM